MSVTTNQVIRIPIAEYDELIRQYNYSGAGRMHFDFLPIACTSIDIQTCTVLQQQRIAQGIKEMKDPLIQDSMISLSVMVKKEPEPKSYVLIYSCWQIVKFFKLLNLRYSPYYIIPVFPEDLLTIGSNKHNDIFAAWSSHPNTICEIITSLFSYIGCNPWLRSDPFVRTFFTGSQTALENEFEQMEKMGNLSSSLQNNATIKTSTVQFNSQAKEFFQKSGSSISNFFKGIGKKDKIDPKTQGIGPSTQITSNEPGKQIQYNSSGNIVGTVDEKDDENFITFSAKRNINDATQNAMNEYIVDYSNYIDSCYNLVNSLNNENQKRLKAIKKPVYEAVTKVSIMSSIRKGKVLAGANVSPFIIPESALGLDSLVTSLATEERFLVSQNALLRASVMPSIHIAKSAIACFKAILKMRQSYLADLCRQNQRIASLTDKKTRLDGNNTEKLVRIEDEIKGEEQLMANTRANINNFTSYLQHAIIVIKEVSFKLITFTVDKYFGFRTNLGSQESQFATVGLNALRTGAGPIVTVSPQNGNISLNFAPIQSKTTTNVKTEEPKKNITKENNEIVIESSSTANQLDISTNNILADENWVQDDTTETTEESSVKLNATESRNNVVDDDEEF